MSQTNFKALHYDGTISIHGDLKAAMKEAVERLEPWREGSDRVVQQVNETNGSKLSRILVVNSVNHPTDAASHISPCGDWIDGRQCLPKSNQRVLACWLEENEPVDITECNVTDTEFIRWTLKHAANPTRAWWRPLPPLPDECKGSLLSQNTIHQSFRSVRTCKEYTVDCASINTSMIWL